MNKLPSTPKVSIITPSFNQGQYIEATINSVLSQDYPNKEYIIVDGGSKDESIAIIKKYQNRLGWWVTEKDGGQSDAINKGFSHATGDILAWINSDDLYFPGAISEAVAFLTDHPEVGMVYGDADLIDDQSKPIGKFSAKQTDYRRLLRGSVHIPQATTFFRADIWKQVGPLNLSLFYSFDYDLWVKIAKVTEIRYLPRAWAKFRIHNQGKTVVNDDLCYPGMLWVHDREVGGWLSWLRFRYFVRKMAYAWMPIELRLRIRKLLTF